MVIFIGGVKMNKMREGTQEAIFDPVEPFSDEGSIINRVDEEKPTEAEKMAFYTLDNILKRKAHYYMIFGERSNGKSFAVLLRALTRYIKEGAQTAYIRRWDLEIKGKRAAEVWNNMVCDANGKNHIEELSNGEWNNVAWRNGKWYLCKKIEGEETVMDVRPFAFAFALNEQEHDKSLAYPGVKLVLFEEFLTRKSYLVDEFITYCNVLSTIIRHRKDVEIFMLGNTVNKFCPYFAEMGLKHVAQMKQGDIDVYTYGKSGLRVAVEYSDSPNKGKPSDVYFAFNNPKLQMITTGAWELDLYPHLPYKYERKDILFTYFVIFEDNILQCEIIKKNKGYFTYIHSKSTEIRKPDKDLIYTLTPDPRPNYKRKLISNESKLESKVSWFFTNNKVFYQDNDIGEIIRNYLLVSGSKGMK